MSVFRRLRPGGLFALWENNPWNPGTRYVMSRIPFDRDAVPLAPPEARRLVRACGFEVLRTDFLFLFPRALRLMRPLEARLSRLPLGAQYQVLCRRPLEREPWCRPCEDQPRSAWKAGRRAAALHCLPSQQAR